MDNARRTELLGEIANLQAGIDKYNSDGTAPITLKIGWSADWRNVDNNGILITDCPPAIVTAIGMWVDATNRSSDTLVTAAVFNGGLLVT